ncbi:MAG: MlaD family protein [Pirellulaceae bacterium]|jgi:phospholipid/cholesterol/gamma-HCH transport system substrate-binding protein|nr:MlaD family protein [Pirellulaceae bacterium]MDP6557458.1 MlaD family protein [Pirellulaceae bacterium]
MNERVIQFRVGVVVVAAAIITFILVVIFGQGLPFVVSQYTVNLHFPRAPGVTVGTPVRKQGVLIGRISRVEIDDELGGVNLTAKIDRDKNLYEDELCYIKTSSLIGDPVLEFVQPKQFVTPRTRLQDDGLVANGIVGSDPLEVISNLEGNVRDVLTSIESAAGHVGTLAESLNSTFGAEDDSFGRLVRKSELALDQFSNTMTTIDEVIGDPEMRRSLKQSLAGLPAAMEEMRTTMTAARSTLAGFDRMSGKAEVNLDNLEKFTEPLGERGEALVANVDASVASLDELLRQLVTFGEALNNSEGSLGQFVHNRELYDSLNDAATRIEKATRTIAPIMQNVNTLTDKLARDPRLLGIKGALDRKPSGAGLNTAPSTMLPTYHGRDPFPR